jgi:hypothetical protein
MKQKKKKKSKKTKLGQELITALKEANNMNGSEYEQIQLAKIVNKIEAVPEVKSDVVYHHPNFGPVHVQFVSEEIDPVEEGLEPHPKRETAIKHDSGKPRMSLISPIASFKLAEVMTDGESKYNAHNWRNGFKWSRIVDAALRHIEIWNAGMDKDPDSGRSNLAHAAACIMMLLEFEETHKELDDRYKLPDEILNKLYPKKDK